MLVIHSESTEMVGIFHKLKFYHKRRSNLLRLAMNTSLFFPKDFFEPFLLNKVFRLLSSPNNKIESEMAYNTTTALDELSCTDYVDLGKCQDIFG